MKINDVTKIYGAYGVQPTAGQQAKKAASPAGRDRLMLSRDAIDFQTVMKGLKASPDIRAAKVSEISVKYETGDHLADTRDIADALYKSGALRRGKI